MAVQSNKDVYSTVEFSRWADRERLGSDEQAVIETYLRKDGRTVDAGTGGGRIALAMHDLGYQSLVGFDFVPEFIDSARKRDSAGRIQFDVADATALPYSDASFDQIAYLQQILCLIEGDDARARATREANRILKPGGPAVFSFLCYEVRSASRLYAALLAYWRVLRAVSGSRRPPQEIPWLRLGGKFNPRSLLDRGPYVYWFSVDDAVSYLSSFGFEVVGVGSGRQAREGGLAPSAGALAGKPLEGLLFVACRKVSEAAR